MNLFLSSTVKDLKEYRRAVRNACLHKAETACLLSEEDWSSGYDDTVAKCEERIREANAFMLLVGYWYGSIPPGRDRSITHIEFDEALKRWGVQKFPPMAVMMPVQGSAAEKKLREAAKSILLEQCVDAIGHEKSLSDFHSAVTGSWRTVTWFKNRNELLQIAIANCWKWKGHTALAAARGEVAPQGGQPVVSQVTDEQLGRLGREPQFKAAKAALSKLADHSDVPALSLIVYGDDDAGQRAFLQWLNNSVLKSYVPKRRLARLPLEYSDPSVLASWIAQLLGVAGNRRVQTPEQLAECIAPELKRQPMYFILDRVADLVGGVMAFRDCFWQPLYRKLYELRATQQFVHRLVAVVSDYSGDEAAWEPATFMPDLKGGRPDYTKLLRIPRLGPFLRDDFLDWFSDLGIPDEPAGRRSRLANRAMKNSHGEDDTMPMHVFERLRAEILWPEGATE